MLCRGCDAPIDSDTYCERCLQEIDSLIYAKPFAWPKWFISTRNVVLFVTGILVVWYLLVQVMLAWPDTSSL